MTSRSKNPCASFMQQSKDFIKKPQQKKKAPLFHGPCKNSLTIESNGSIGKVAARHQLARMNQPQALYKNSS